MINNFKLLEGEFDNMEVNDKRIIDRTVKSIDTLVEHPCESIPAAFEDCGQTKAFYRLIKNDNFEASVLLECHRKRTIERIINEDTILQIQDTTELDFTTHKKTKGLGPYGGNKNSRGLIMHSTLAVTPKGVTLGIMQMNIWARDIEKRGESKKSRKRPIEEKESYKWLQSMDSSKGIPENVTVINVSDRDSDFCEYFCKGIKENKKFLVRASHDRKIKDEDEKLYSKVESMEEKGQIIVNIPRDTRNNLSPRTAILSVRYMVMEIVLPPYLKKTYADMPTIKINFVIVKEIDPPQGIEPIEWRLSTNLEVETLEDAALMVKYYVQRWKIERFHYILKSGCNVQSLQMEDAEHLIKTIAIYSIVAWILLWLVYESRERGDESCEIIFSEKEWKILSCIGKKKTTPQEEPLTLKESVLYIAKLGGFLGRKHDGEPGVKVIWKGLMKFYTIMKYYGITSNIEW